MPKFTGFNSTVRRFKKKGKGRKKSVNTRDQLKTEIA
jgi:hypothetical protein